MQKKRRNFLPELILLLVISTNIVMTMTLSKYKSTVAGSDNTEVAAFIIDTFSEDGQSNSLDLDCNADVGYTVNYKFNVTNEKNSKVGEVTTKYTIKITLAEKLPDGITVKLDNNNPSNVSSNQLTYTFIDAGVLQSGQAQTNPHTLSFVADPNIVNYDMSITGIGINVIAEQID